MQIPRFQRLRGRLSYANVMATLAFFFALTGGAMATAKYLTANDPISAGDLAGSTYGTPLIAAGKVTSEKIADGAITSSKFESSATAPDADKLGGLAPSAFATIVGSGSVHVPGGSIPTGGCIDSGVFAPAGTDAATDFVLAQPAGSLGEVSATGFLRPVDDHLGLFITGCNGASFARSIEGDYPYLILR